MNAVANLVVVAGYRFDAQFADCGSVRDAVFFRVRFGHRGVDEVRRFRDAVFVERRRLVDHHERRGELNVRVRRFDDRLTGVVRRVVVENRAAEFDVAVQDGESVRVDRFDRQRLLAGSDDRQRAVFFGVDINVDRGRFEVDDVIVGGRPEKNQIVGGRARGQIDGVLQRGGVQVGQLDHVDLRQRTRKFKIGVSVANIVVFGVPDRIDRQELTLFQVFHPKFARTQRPRDAFAAFPLVAFSPAKDFLFLVAVRPRFVAQSIE